MILKLFLTKMYYFLVNQTIIIEHHFIKLIIIRETYNYLKFYFLLLIKIINLYFLNFLQFITFY